MNVDVNRLLDAGRWTTFQKLLIAGTALTIILDGIDNQLLATAIPDLMKEWTLQRGDFSTALAMSPFGMLVGGIWGGWLGDRLGRRSALLMSVLFFAVPTALIYFAHNVSELSGFRFLAGLGLGGAMPSATALASEYVPRRQRPFAVTLTIVCVPVGATLAAEFSARIIPVFGWRNFFLLGGAIPLVLGAFLFAILPESPRYLASRRKRWPELRALLGKMGIDVPQETVFGEAETVGVEDGGAGDAGRRDAGRGAAGKPRGSMAYLFSADRVGDTLCLIGAFFFCLLTVYLSLQLLVTALTSAGFSALDARRTLFWWNVGGVIGALMGALIIQRLGSRVTMLALCAVAMISCFGLAALPLNGRLSAAGGPAPTTQALLESRGATSTGSALPPAVAAATAPKTVAAKSLYSLQAPVGMALILMCVVMGAAINAVQVSLYALAAHIYPTAIRGTGLGLTIAVGRIGNVLASYVGNAALDRGISYFFGVSGVGMGLVLIALALIRRHVERTGGLAAVGEVEISVSGGQRQGRATSGEQA